MPIRVSEFRATPNPNAVKCVLAGPLSGAAATPPPPRSYLDQASASGDALASRLLALPGVAGVLIHADWITVNKTPDAAWPGIHRGIERVLGEF